MSDPIQHSPRCSRLLAPTYELIAFANILVSRCPECGRRAPHPRTLSAADIEPGRYDKEPADD